MSIESTALEELAKPEAFERSLHAISLFFESAGVAAMVLGVIIAVVHAWRMVARGSPLAETYHPFRTTLARSILLGLEFLVAADIIGTVAAKPTIQNLSVLGLIVVIRTVLSFALQIEISGRLPWRSAPAGEEKRGGAPSA